MFNNFFTNITKQKAVIGQEKQKKCTNSVPLMGQKQAIYDSENSSSKNKNNDKNNMDDNNKN